MKLVLGFILALSILQTTFAGSKGGHGGETIDVLGPDGHKYPELRDIVEMNRACLWQSGTDYMKKFPYLEHIFQKLKEINWYFALDFKREMSRITFCQTQGLNPKAVNTEDVDSLRLRIGQVSNPALDNKRVAAIRINDDVYIDTEIIEQMRNRSDGDGEKSVAFLMVHETMHSYLSFNEYRRNDRIRDLVATIIRVDAGIISEPSDFLLQLEKSNAIFLSNISDKERYMEEISEHQKLIEYINSSEEIKKKKIFEIEDIEKTFDAKIGVFKGLYVFDQEQIKLHSSDFVIKSYCKNQNNKVVDWLLSQKYEKHNAFLLCLSTLSYKDGNQNFLQTLIKSKNFSEQLDSFYQTLAQKKVFVENKRIKANKEMKLLIGDEPVKENSTVTGLPLPSPYNLNSTMKGAMVLLSSIIRTNNKELVSSYISENENFYHAFEIKTALKDIEQIADELIFEEDRIYSQITLARLISNLKKALASEIQKNGVTKQQIEELWQDIDWGRIGVGFRADELELKNSSWEKQNREIFLRELLTEKNELESKRAGLILEIQKLMEVKKFKSCPEEKIKNYKNQMAELKSVLDPRGINQGYAYVSHLLTMQEKKDIYLSLEKEDKHRRIKKKKLNCLNNTL